MEPLKVALSFVESINFQTIDKISELMT